MSEAIDATGQAVAISQLVAALGGPAVVGGILLAILKKSLHKIDDDQTSKFDGMASRFDVVAKEMQEVIDSAKTLESTLSDIKTRIAVYEIQSSAMARAIEEFRAMDKNITLMQSKVDAAFRVIDDMRQRVDRADARSDRVEAELAGIREALRR